MHLQTFASLPRFDAKRARQADAGVLMTSQRRFSLDVGLLPVAEFARDWLEEARPVVGTER